MLTTLSSIASMQSAPTAQTMANTKLFLDYAATHQDAVVTYQASNMVLVVHSDMRPTSVNLNHAAGLEATSSCHPTQLTLQTTAPS
jgi:hypothetical protein